jgi:hypothetical protein
MNNIFNLIEIIEQLGGSATIKQICSFYAKKHGIIEDSTYLLVVEQTLKNNLDKVVNSQETNEWKIVEKDSKSVKANNTGIHKTHLSIDEVKEILKNVPELNPAEYDGSYLWVDAAIKEYAKLNDFSKVDVNDMDFIYSLAVGTWKMSVSVKKNKLQLTNLSNDSKIYMEKMIDDIWNKAQKDSALNQGENTANYEKQVGMFGTGFMTFKGKLSNEDARSFIKMCTEVVDLDNENQIYDICSKTLNDSFDGKGLGAASASAILHCLKPYSFPIINKNDGHGTIFELLGIKLYKYKKVQTYINNCREIKKYRDNNFKFKNYRILDIAMWSIDGDFDIKKHLGME